MSPDGNELRYHSEGMWLLRANNIDLITSDTAIEIVRRVVRDRYGQEEVDRDEPLTVKDDSDTWLVRGTISPSVAGSRQAWMGPIHGRIAKFDGQILGFIFEGDSEKLFGAEMDERLATCSASDELLYLPRNVRAHKLYGFSPVSRSR